MKKNTIIFFIILIVFFVFLWFYFTVETKVNNDAAILQQFVNDCKAEAGGFLREDQLGEIIIKAIYTKKKINKSLDPIVQDTCPKAAANFIKTNYNM